MSESNGTSFGDNDWGIAVDMNFSGTSNHDEQAKGQEQSSTSNGVATASASGSSAKSHTKKKSKQETVKPVELGFVEDEGEKEDLSWKLRSPYFPSKLGGKPSWLELKKLPDSKLLKCSSCDGATKFLLQIYAPLDDPSAFHRTIFVFVCSNQQCCVEKNSSKNIIVVRCQLERQNEFYSSEPPSYDDPKLGAEITPEKWGIKLCRVCGCKGTFHCSRCKRVNYCSKEHQALDWKSGHKTECDDSDFKVGPSSSPHHYNFKEYEVTIDKEILPKAEKRNQNPLVEYQKLIKEGKAGTLGNDTTTTKELMEAASYKSDKAFNKFRKRIACNPDQVLRYDRAGEPLWVSSDKVPSKEDVPNCSYCGSPRIFEFQVMPQLLNYLGEDSRSGSLDWGTFAAYTCERSCIESESYKKEFVWLQHFKDDPKDED